MDGEDLVFPLRLSTAEIGQINAIEEDGLTKREYFAACALQGLCVQNFGVESAALAEEAVKIADALLDALDSTP